MTIGVVENPNATESPYRCGKCEHPIRWSDVMDLHPKYGWAHRNCPLQILPLGTR